MEFLCECYKIIPFIYQLSIIKPRYNKIQFQNSKKRKKKYLLTTNFSVTDRKYIQIVGNIQLSEKLEIMNC